MTVSYFPVILGAVVAIWAGEGAAREPFAANGSGAMSAYDDAATAPYDSYVADSSVSSVVEMSPTRASSPQDSYAAESPLVPLQAGDDCGEHAQTVFANGPSGTVYGTACRQPDGSLRIFAAPSNADTYEDAWYADTSSPISPTSDYCREYRETVIVDGTSRAVYGTACWQPDGSWWIVTPAPVAAASAIAGGAAYRAYPIEPYYPIQSYYPNDRVQMAPTPATAYRSYPTEVYQPDYQRTRAATQTTTMAVPERFAPMRFGSSTYSWPTRQSHPRLYAPGVSYWFLPRAHPRRDSGKQKYHGYQDD